jgi:adenine-specific DNA-methyltransferase
VAGKKQAAAAAAADDARDLSDLTREELIERLEAQSEGGIRIQFSGKARARKIARKVRPRVLREVDEIGAGPEEERARNLIIEGDNLQAMATLYRDRGQVDLIIADPPYNTGNDFRYSDRWETDPNDPGLGELVKPDDGARHTKWMRFMYPRLQMMKSMLKPGGILAICIDHRELFHLGQMLDEPDLFGTKNRLAIINWQKMAGAKNHDKGVSTATEYVLVYTKNEERAVTGKIPHTERTLGGYTNPDHDTEDVWAPSDSTLMGASTHPGQVYAIQNPFTGRLHRPQEGRCWRNERGKMKAAVEAWGVEYEDVDIGDGLRPALIIKGCRNPAKPNLKNDPALQAARKAALARRDAGNWPRFFWRSDRRRRPGEGELRYKTYAYEVSEGVVPTTFWADDDFTPLWLDAVSWQKEQSGTSDTGQRELNAVVGRGHGFETVKPLMLFNKIISIWCPPTGTVLDPFAGSGTTAHAVLDLNATTGSTRRFLLIEQGRPERGDGYARTLCADRVRRVVTGDWKTGERDPAGGGYRFYTLDKKVDAAALLSMERDEMTDTVIASHFDATRRRGVGLCRFPPDKYRYLVAKNTDDEGFFLIWEGAGNNTDFDEDVYEVCAEEAAAAGLTPRYHVYARLYLFQTSNVVFYQIPDRILRDFGLDLRGEPFSED